MPTQEFFTPVAFDFLWEQARVGELPYPLTVRSHGETETERMALRRRANTEFAARRIEDTPVPEWINLLAWSTVSIDALFIPEFQAHPVGALAASDGSQAVLAVQDADGVWLRPIYPDGLASAIVGLLPRTPRGTEASITLPMDEALRARPARQGVLSASPGGGARRRASLADRPADPREAYAQLIGQPRLRGGQFAANSRDNLGGKRRSSVLAWFDTASGRYLSSSRAGTDGREWVTVAPAEEKTLRTRLAELLASVAD